MFQSPLVINYNDSVTNKPMSSLPNTSRVHSRSILSSSHLNTSDTNEDASMSNRELIDSALSSFFSNSQPKKSKSKATKRKLVTENRACITSVEAKRMLVEEEAAKRLRIMSAEKKNA